MYGPGGGVGVGAGEGDGDDGGAGLVGDGDTAGVMSATDVWYAPAAR